MTYEFECPIHGIFEKVLPMDRWDIDWVPCELGMVIVKGVHIPCEELAERVPSLTSMQPDKYWSGQIVHGKYVTSKRDISPDIEPATRDKLELIAKRKVQREAEIKEKQDKALNEYLTSELAGVTIEPDGSSFEERQKYERARGRDYTGTTE